MLGLESEMRKGQAEFVQVVRDFLMGLDAKPLTRYESEGVCNETFEVSTKAGPLFVSVVPTLRAPFIGGCVNTAFQDIDRACDFFGVDGDRRPNPFTKFNPATGKWNHVLVGSSPIEVGRILSVVLRDLLEPAHV